MVIGRVHCHQADRLGTDTCETLITQLQACLTVCPLKLYRSVDPRKPSAGQEQQLRANMFLTVTLKVPMCRQVVHAAHSMVACTAAVSGPAMFRKKTCSTACHTPQQQPCSHDDTATTQQLCAHGLGCQARTLSSSASGHCNPASNTKATVQWPAAHHALAPLASQLHHANDC